MHLLTEKNIHEILEGINFDPQQLTAVLLEIQELSGRSYVDELWAKQIARELCVPITLVYEILTFYSMFSCTPRGRFVIEVCESAPCHFQDAESILSIFQESLGIKTGETTKDGLFTLERTSCIGECDRGPSVRIGERVFGNLNREKIQELIQGFKESSFGAGEGL
jgi:NADH:ubiquinone oxidoreductase subunit E